MDLSNRKQLRMGLKQLRVSPRMAAVCLRKGLSVALWQIGVEEGVATFPSFLMKWTSGK